MEDESEEFMDLFENGISYIEGGRTSSGFYSVDAPVSFMCVKPYLGNYAFVCKIQCWIHINLDKDWFFFTAELIFSWLEIVIFSYKQLFRIKIWTELEFIP